MKTILINHTQKKTRAAVLSDGALVSYYVADEEEPKLIGNIYKGRVQNILPGMQAAFVDIGTERNAFLQFGRKKVPTLEIDGDVLIQIEKEAVGTKGPRATLMLSMPGRSLVLLPNSKSIGVSHKVGDAERNRLFKLAATLRPADCGLIMRTAAADCSDEELTEEVERLHERWQAIAAGADKKKSPSLIYSENDLLSRVMREELCDELERFVLDNRKMYVRALSMVKDLMPQCAARIEHYDGAEPIFEAFGLEEEVKKISAREIELPSGGAIVIDRTEAMTVIDVNTGKFYGGSNLSETVFQTNLEAAEVILKQLRLRDISGIIIIDFIDMNRAEQREELMEYLRAEALKDRKRVHVVDMTPLGLVELTRRNCQ